MILSLIGLNEVSHVKCFHRGWHVVTGKWHQSYWIMISLYSLLWSHLLPLFFTFIRLYWLCQAHFCPSAFVFAFPFAWRDIPSDEIYAWLLSILVPHHRAHLLHLTVPNYFSWNIPLHISIFYSFYSTYQYLNLSYSCIYVSLFIFWFLTRESRDLVRFLY